MCRPYFKIVCLMALLILSAEASAQVNVSGLMSLVTRNSDVADITNKTNFRVSPFDALNVRLFFDGAITENLSGFVQLYFGSTYSFTPIGAYIRYDPSHSAHLEAGLIPTPVGLWGQRAYADKNPLVSVPLIYQYKTALDAGKRLQAEAGDILEPRGAAKYAPIVYDFCWNTGVHGYGSWGALDGGVALLNGSLGSPKRNSTYNRPSVVAHLGWTPNPYVRIGSWAAAGPYLSPGFEALLPGTYEIEDYQQQTFGAHAHVSAGHAEFYAEALFNRYQHPFLGDLDNVGGYADGRYSFATRWYVAGRVDVLSFSRLDDPAASGARWDYPLQRYEIGIGRKLTPRSVMKVVVQIVRYDGAPSGLEEEVFALQFTTGM